MKRMPILFVGHGSPMNTLNDNKYIEEWKQLGQKLPKPKAILAISAHWYTRGDYVTGHENPPQIYDFYGFPQELYNIKYEVKGSPSLAMRVAELVPDL